MRPARAAAAVAAAELLVWLVVTWRLVMVPIGPYDRLPFMALFLVPTIVVGWLLASRLPANPIGWLLLGISALWLSALVAAVLGNQLLGTDPDTAAWLLWYGGMSGAAGWGWLPPLGLMFTQLLLLFPDGHLPSPGWRAFQRFALVVLIAASLGLATSQGEVAPGLSNPMGRVDPDALWLLAVLFGALPASFLGSAGSLAWRYRRSDDLARRQIRVVVIAGALSVTGLMFDNDLAFLLLVGAAFSLIPISMGVAVLRYRLYEIDRVISRTVAYFLVTAVVIATYAIVVTSVSRLLPASNTLAVAGATLAAAAVFRPALTRLRDGVDRRFDRARFDAAREIDAYAERVRDQVDPTTITTDLAEVIQRTLAPTTLAIWTPGTAGAQVPGEASSARTTAADAPAAP